MPRTIHAVPTLVLSVLVIALALSGALLALVPAGDRFAAEQVPTGSVSVAELAASVVQAFPGTERIDRTSSGQIVVAHTEAGTSEEILVSPRTGARIGPVERSALFDWIAGFHNALWLGDSAIGHALVGLGALALLVIAVSGLQLLVVRMGSWRQIAGPVRGDRAQRIHVRISRWVTPILLISGITGCLLSLYHFGLLPDGSAEQPVFPDAVDGGPPAPIDELAALQAVDLNDLRTLVFPFDGDPDEPFELVTAAGAGFVDQATGELLSWQPHSAMRTINTIVVALHSGEGLWWFGLVAGAAGLTTPLLASSGLTVWWRQRRAKPRVRRNVSVEDADTVILVGSEGNTTWGFADTLQSALGGAGFFVHVAPMNHLSAAHTGDKRLFLLTASYGDGSAPGSADRFLERLSHIDTAPRHGVVVLGFGDREFDHYCAFAEETEAAIAAKGWTQFAPLHRINRQSPQEFSRWGDLIGGLLGVDLRLVHIADHPKTRPFELLSREDYGQATDAPVAIMRFIPPRDGKQSSWRFAGRRGLPDFEAGDLMGIVPPGSNMPRYYSLASAREDGFLEISVRRHAQGLCSRFLHDLEPGDTVQSFVRPNPEFRLQPGKTPVIMLGVGCGVGPLAGFVRANRTKRPMRLYFGARHPDSDFLYRDDMARWLDEGKLSGLVTAFSRTSERTRLQDRILGDADTLREMVDAGATIMVVGGRGMAEDVLAAFDQVVEPTGKTAAMLKAEGRYLEDIF